jgi:hypothetical protein
VAATQNCKTYQRESSDNPMLNAFCRVAPSERLSVLAIFGAGVFFLAMDFKVRTCSVDQGTFLRFLAMWSPMLKGLGLVTANVSKEKPCAREWRG